MFRSKDQHEICFVGDEGFADLSQVDPNGDKLLQEAMEADKSNEWYEKKKKSKEAAKWNKRLLKIICINVFHCFSFELLVHVSNSMGGEGNIIVDVTSSKSDCF